MRRSGRSGPMPSPTQRRQPLTRPRNTASYAGRGLARHCRGRRADGSGRADGRTAGGAARRRRLRFRSAGSAIVSTASTRRNCIRTAPTPHGQTWPCGTRARTELRRIIGTHPVQCRTVSTDRFGRNIAVCHAGGRDIAEEMVRAGFATTFERRGSSNPYVAVQAEARDDKRGIWAGRFDVPGEWRRANPRDDDVVPSSSPSPRDWLARKGCGTLAGRVRLGDAGRRPLTGERPESRDRGF